MNEWKPNVLTGGQRLDLSASNHHFISAYVTDTRLMGVLAVYAHWHVDNLDGPEDGSGVTWGDLHQFFYIDCEETGLETYQQVRVSDQEEVEAIEQALIGGFGAEKIELDEEQLRQILCYYRRFNEERGLPLPEGERDYGFLFDPDKRPDDEQLRKLMDLTCVDILTDEHLIHYFLMRCFGGDLAGAGYLAEKDVPLDLYRKFVPATFCRNVIDAKVIGSEKDGAGDDSGKAGKSNGVREYLCESLIECKGNYIQVISQVRTRGGKVVFLSCLKESAISEGEAALQLKKVEYVNVYEVFLSAKELEDNLGEFTVKFHTQMSDCENGRLFLAYRRNNSHVNQRIFLLSNDVEGLYFLSNHGQLIAAAYSPEDMAAIEKRIRSSMLAPYLVASGKYEFRDPLLYEFIHSDIDHFETFLELLGEGE